jgi:peptidoglycan hydrolase-like protein with peptidoglycan-binding domain
MRRLVWHWPFGGVLALAVGVAAAPAACLHTRAAPPPPETVPATKPEVERGAETGTPVASTPQGLLHDGAERRIQERLRAEGLLTEAQLTGRLDPATQQALRDYQKREGLPATGLPSYETVEHLGLKLDSVFRSRANIAKPPS